MNVGEMKKVREEAREYAYQNAEKWTKILHAAKEGSPLWHEALVARRAYVAAVEHFFAMEGEK